MSSKTELSARKLSVTSLLLIAIGATSWWAITILANYSDFFYDDYRYELATEDADMTPKGEEPFQFYERIYEPVVSPSTYLILTGILVFAMTALWARQIANRTNAQFEATRLSKTASVWSFIAVILALVMGVVFGFATFVESLSRREDIDVGVRLLSTYVPILLTAGLLLFVALRAFVLKPEVKND